MVIRSKVLFSPFFFFFFLRVACGRGAHYNHHHQPQPSTFNSSKQTMGVGTHLLVLLFLTIPFTLAVDHNKFRTCKDTDFCKRNRELQPASSPYHVVAGTVKSSSDKITAEIVNTYNKAQYVMEITTYPDRILRLHINEKSPLKPRYQLWNYSGLVFYYLINGKLTPCG
jgi:hypothetical protein